MILTLSTLHYSYMKGVTLESRHSQLGLAKVKILGCGVHHVVVCSPGFNFQQFVFVFYLQKVLKTFTDYKTRTSP